MLARWCACVLVPALGTLGDGFRVQSNLTLIDASVVDRADRFIPGLDRSQFRIFERGVEQRITAFSLEDAPVSFVIVFDVSGSMAGAIPLAREALASLLRRGGPQDEYCVVTVRSRPQLAMDFTRDPGPALARIGAAPPAGATALFDAVYLALHALRRGANSRKALLVISDGLDNNSRYTALETLRALRESYANLYAVGVGSARAPSLFPDPILLHSPPGAEALGDLARESGGRYFEAEDPADLPGVLERLNVRYTYVLGYTPVPLYRDGKYHRVDLKLAGRARQSGFRAYWRRGYYAPHP